MEYTRSNSENIENYLLESKTLIGAFEKSFLYDDIGKNPKQARKVDYVIRQSRKVLQNKQKSLARKGTVIKR